MSRSRLASVMPVLLVGLLASAAPASAGILDPVDTYETGGQVYGMAIADMDRDGNADIVAGNDDGDDHISLLRGKGDGTFRAERRINDSRGPEGIAVGRFDGDKLPDFAAADYDASKLSIFLNKGGGEFKLERKLAGGPGNWLLEAGDLDRDGRVDLVTGNYDTADGTDAVSVHLGKAGGAFKARQDFEATASDMYGLALGRVDGDKRLDAVTIDSAGTMSVLLGEGDGGFGPAETEDFTAAAPGYGVALGRFDAGDTLDVALPLASSDQVAILPGDGEGDFGLPLFDDGADNAYGLAAGDFNRDGDLDLVTRSSTTTGVAMLVGNGDGSFGLPDPQEGSDQVEVIERGRLDGDNRLDVVAGTDTGVDVFLGSAG